MTPPSPASTATGTSGFASLAPMAFGSAPGPVGVDTVIAELTKLEAPTALGLSTDLFGAVSRRSVQRWHDRFQVTRPSALVEMTQPDRVLLTTAWATRRTQLAIDGVVDLLIAIIHKIKARAERRVEREHLADLTRVHGKTKLLYRLAEAHDSGQSRTKQLAWSVTTTLLPRLPRKHLRSQLRKNRRHD